MKYLKTLLLASVAVVAFAALVSSASAKTVICASEGTVKPTDCPSTHPWEFVSGAGKTIKATSTNATLVTSVATIVCGESATTVEPNASTSETSITGNITALTWTNCHLTNEKETKCTVTTERLPYEAHLEGTVGGNTNVSSLTVTGKPGAHVECGAIINCKYSKATVALGGENTGGGISFSANEELEREGGLCPAGATWTATYHANGITVH